MANLKSITELPIAESAEGLNLIVNDNGAAKQIAASAVGAQADFAVTDEASPAFIKNKPAVVQADWAEMNDNSPAFIKNKPSKELVYEWGFSAEDEVYEIYENINEDLSWLTKKQDDISFEIVVENYAYQYDWNNEESYEENRIILEDVFSIVSSMESPYFSRGVNIPFSGQQFICKEVLSGEVYGLGIEDNYQIDDTTDRYFKLYPSAYFSIYNGLHFDFDNGGVPTNVENGGNLLFGADDCPFKSVKIYKITR